MKTVRAKENQTIYDVALEQYGTCDGIVEIMKNNPNLRNKPEALVALGIDRADSSDDFYPDVVLAENEAIVIDTDSHIIRGAVVRQLENDITTYDQDNGENN